MLKFKGVLLLVFLCLLSFKGFATYTWGCVSDDTGYIYPNDAYGTTYESTPVVYTSGTGAYCNPTYYGTCRIRTTSQCRQCTTKPDKDGWYYQSGREYYYYPCPIDDYVGLILVAVAGLGVLAIRKGLLFS